MHLNPIILVEATPPIAITLISEKLTGIDTNFCSEEQKEFMHTHNYVETER